MEEDFVCVHLAAFHSPERFRIDRSSDSIGGACRHQDATGIASSHWLHDRTTPRSTGGLCVLVHEAVQEMDKRMC